ncbi:AGAP002497-PA-like protein [Anopheles sinensis]|uniref:AGAP002497-PA-like protein n=1 Tax=Anopheles sinensis TaxID=74873 RepID=A0A084VAN9_ANOSI|nr:AGAP002497-PA-like protein [Anopheles sinensis]
MMPNFYDGSRPTMVPTSSNLPVLLGNTANQGDPNAKKLVHFDLEATLQTIDNEVLDGEEGSCPICNKTFSRKTSLLNHIRNHSAEKKYVCEFCQKGFTQQANLRNHVRIHTNERPYVCVDCGKAFTQCPDKSFKQQSHLQQHMKIHGTNFGYSCTKCEEKFIQESHLVLHMKQHGDYACNMCSMTFNDEVLLKKHVQRHVDGRYLTCPVISCGEGFTMKNHLTKHMQMHHPAVDLKKLGAEGGTDKTPKHYCHYHNCNDSFDTADGLSNHLRVAHGLPIALPLPLPIDDKKLIQHGLHGLNGIETPPPPPPHLLHAQLHPAASVMNASFQSYQNQINQANQQTSNIDNKQKVLSEKMNNFNRIKTELQANMLAQTQNLFGISNTLNNTFTGPPKLICTYCYNVFKTPQTLSRHIEKFHS